MSRLVARAETFERVYSAFSSINFAAFDYDTVKQSLLDYVKLYFPETFNDFIESSEFIAIIETFAYIAELIAYRVDINAHENFISTAQRKDSILRLAKLVSYTASRPLPARGLVKITSVMTTETVIDANGNDLTGRRITWGDASNPSWKDQFVLVMNKVLEQDFGTVGPTDRFQIQDVLFELYSWNLTPITSGVFTYGAQAGGKTAPMELVPVEHDTTLGIIERRPQNNSNFTFLYGQDGLGDSSNTTGFFCYTKQGTLQHIQTTFDGITPNQTYDVAFSNVNDTDVWVNQIDPETGDIVDIESTLPYRKATLSGKSGEWVPVDLAHAQNVIFNTNPKRNKYEIETLENSKIRLIFGDGEFADVPNGTFDIWFRTSLDKDSVVSQTSVSNTPASFTYVDSYNRTQTFSFTFSLIGSLQNASAAEEMEHVRVTAPAVYYSQDRMVNGKDYNVFMLQDPSILKLRAINRTFAGDSKYIQWHDATGTYENVKIFGNDGIVYYEDKLEGNLTPTTNINSLISLYIEPLLSSTDLYIQLASYANFNVTLYRRVFNNLEVARLVSALTAPPTPVHANMYYNTSTNEWFAVKESDLDLNGAPSSLTGWPGDYIPVPLITITQAQTLESRYTVSRLARRMIFESPSTAFWSTNDATKVIDYDTLDSNTDSIVILKANTADTRRTVLKTDINMDVLGQVTYESGPELALPDIHRLSVLPIDANSDGTPDNIPLDGFLHPTVPITASTITNFNNVIPGTGYRTGPIGTSNVYKTYYGVPLIGGSGEKADADITIQATTVDDVYLLTTGAGYVAGTYTNIPTTSSSVTGGTGTGATLDITVVDDSYSGYSHVTPGTGYVSPATAPYTYDNVPTQSVTGSGYGLTLNVQVAPGRGAITTFAPFPGYPTYQFPGGDHLHVPLTDGSSGEGAFVNVSVIAPYNITSATVSSAGSGYPSGTFYNLPLDGGTGTGATANVTVSYGGFLTAIGTPPNNAGSGYQPGTYYNVPASNIQGVGTGATLNVVVGAGGLITSVGSISHGYGFSPSSGSYSNVPTYHLSGSGTGATLNVTIVPTAIASYGVITPGSAYTDGSYSSVPMTGGSGSGATANITVTGGVVTAVSVVTPGYGYNVGESLSTAAANIGGTGTSFSVLVGTTSGAISSASISAPGTGYQIGDVITVETFYPGSPLSGGGGFSVTVAGVNNSAAGVVTSATVSSAGINYAINDLLTVGSGYLGGTGSGFSVYVTGASAPGGQVSGLTIVNQGLGYTAGDVLIAGSGGGYPGGGSNMAIYVNSVNNLGPVSSISMVDGGINYAVGDWIQLTPANMGGGTNSNTYQVTGIASGGVTAVLGAPLGGQGYQVGDIVTVDNVYLGGAGTGFQVTVGATVDGLATEVKVNQGGNNYHVNDILYVSNTYLGGSGSGFFIHVKDCTGGVAGIVLWSGGAGFMVGDVLSANASEIGGTGSGFSLTVTTIGVHFVIMPVYGIVSEGDFTLNGTGSMGGYISDITDMVQIMSQGTSTYVNVKEYVYFYRETGEDVWVHMEGTPTNIQAFYDDLLAYRAAVTNNTPYTRLWARYEGRDAINFAWFHRSPYYHLVDPSPTNIIDTFIITKGYYMSLKRWLEYPQVVKPTPPTPLDLRTSYNYLLDNRMISDTVVLHPGKIKLLFGSKADSSLQCTFKVVRSPNKTLTDNQVKTTLVTTIRNFFDIATWEFGETFYATELFAVIHASLPSEISSVVIVPILSDNQFGDLFQVIAREDEIFYPDISVDNIEVVTAYTATNLRLDG